MHWKATEKAMVARILRDMLREADTALVVGVLHPGNGHSGASVTDAVKSWLRLYAARYSLEIEKPPVVEEEPPRFVPRRRPALLRKERKTK
jgi:hypothetical protein